MRKKNPKRTKDEGINVIKDGRKFINGLFDTMQECPKVSLGVNLLSQLQKCRDSNRPIATIHHAMESLENALSMWEQCFNHRVAALMEEQKRFSEKMISMTLDNQYFNTLLSSHLRKLHLRMVPKHDHALYEIARKGNVEFEKSQAKSSGATSSSSPSTRSSNVPSTSSESTNTTPSVSPLKQPSTSSVTKSSASPTATADDRPTKKRSIAKLLEFKVNEPPKKKKCSDRSVRLQRRDVVKKIHTIVNSMESLASDVPKKKARAITAEEKRWVIESVESVPKKWDSKGKKYVRSRKAIGNMYDHCWKHLMKQDYPPNLKSAQDLRSFIKRANERKKRTAGHKTKQVITATMHAQHLQSMVKYEDKHGVSSTALQNDRHQQKQFQVSEADREGQSSGSPEQVLQTSSETGICFHYLGESVKHGQTH